MFTIELALPGPSRTRTLTGVIVGVGGVLALAAVSIALRPILGDDPVFIAFLIPIALAAYLGGLVPGLVSLGTCAATLSAFFLCCWQFREIELVHVVEAVLLLLVGLLTCAIIAALHFSRTRAEASRKAEAVALKSLERLTANAPGLLHSYRKRPDGTFCVPYASLGYAALFGATPEELSRDAGAVYRAIHPDDVQLVRSAAESSAETLKPWGCEFRVRRADGQEIWVEGQSTPQREPDGGTLWYGFLIDITARKEAERRAREANERFRTYVEQAPLGIVVTDRCGNVSDANSAFFEMVGYSPADLNRISLGDLTAVDDRERVKNDFARCLKTGQIEGEYHALRRDGSSLWVHTRAVMMPDGRPIGFVQDVTNKHRATEALRTSETRFRELAENTPQVFWVAVPGEPGLLYVSPAYEAIWGRSRESLYTSSRAWMEAIHPDDRERVEQGLATHDLVGSFDQEYRILRPDGTLRWIHAKSFPVRNSDGTVLRLLGLAEDITSSRQLEAQLRHTQKMKSIGLLAGGVAHDFNNWLSVISVNAEFIRDAVAPETEAAECLDEIRSAVQSATALTRQLLAFSRRSVMELKVLDLNDIVLETRKMLGRLLGEDITLTTNLCAGATVLVDPDQMVQVMMNLAVNARDAMPQGGKLVVETRVTELDVSYTEMHPQVKPGKYFQLSISDSGCGMSPEIQARVFEPFFTTKGVGRGTGLGLAVVHGIVEQSGGHIQLYSEPDVGTTFNIYLPLAQDPHPAREAAGPPPVRSGTETILLVEDAEPLRRIALRVLRGKNYNVLTASNGKDALDAMDAFGGNIDLVLTDVVMPDLGGRDLAMAVRARHPHTRVLFTSGYTDDAIIRHGILQAEVPFLPKPYTTDSLLRKVRETLDRTSG